ncbi:hypothetical protein IFO70_27995 [Phormidium tenue FACHB-886]|nr:hypothetical protein [Phormidium tenue FACHB-886]
MDESNLDPSLPLSLEQLLEELEHLISFESQHNGHPWLSINRLIEMFEAKYGVSLEYLVLVQGYSDGLRSLLKGSKRFSIYGTQLPQAFYIALFEAVVPGFHRVQTSPTRYKVKQPWEVDGRLLERLDQMCDKRFPSCRSQDSSGDQPGLVSKINSVNDLELALIEIFKGLMANNPKKVVTVAQLSRQFGDYYHQPIRAVMRRVCPDMRLTELLQTVPVLDILKVDDDWQVSLVLPQPVL